MSWKLGTIENIIILMVYISIYVYLYNKRETRIDPSVFNAFSGESHELIRRARGMLTWNCFGGVLTAVSRHRDDRIVDRMTKTPVFEGLKRFYRDTTTTILFVCTAHNTTY